MDAAFWKAKSVPSRLLAKGDYLETRFAYAIADFWCGNTFGLHLSLTEKWTWYDFAEMALARTFVSFSSTDVGSYRLMCAWKAHEHIDFDFADFQLDEAINSKNPSYIKSVCRAKIRRADTFVLLIGADTWQKTVFVKAEVEVAIEKECRLIGVNLNNCRFKDGLCPEFFANKGAIFVPFSSRIVTKALTWKREAEGDWHFNDHVYTNLGYDLVGDTAVMPPPVNPFTSGRPPWATNRSCTCSDFQKQNGHQQMARTPKRRSGSVRFRSGSIVANTDTGVPEADFWATQLSVIQLPDSMSLTPERYGGT